MTIKNSAQKQTEERGGHGAGGEEDGEEEKNTEDTRRTPAVTGQGSLASNIAIGLPVERLISIGAQAIWETAQTHRIHSWRLTVYTHRASLSEILQPSAVVTWRWTLKSWMKGPKWPSWISCSLRKTDLLTYFHRPFH